MAVLVTGGAGFIGSHLVEQLLQEGRDVVCLDNFSSYYDPRIKRANLAQLLKIREFPVYEADVRDRDACERVFQDQRIDAIAHLAASVGVRHSVEEPASYEDVNCRGTINLLELARRHEVGKFVFGSTSSIYGATRRVPFVEDDPVACPISPYAASKRAAELFCYTYHHLHGLQVACARFFTVYGPWGRPDMAVYKFTQLIDQGKPIPVYGDATSRRDYTYCKDVVQGVVKAIDTPVGYEVFNLGESRVVELNRLISLIEENLGKTAKRQLLPEQPGDVPITYADLSKSRRVLGYDPQYPFEEGLRLFIEWYRHERPRFD
ncbi:MAG: epimerase [Planctomycetes bacterium SM23_32]|nr:MAG: epimerase [Planctomycetes bacterium SM23_32]